MSKFLEVLAAAYKSVLPGKQTAVPENKI